MTIDLELMLGADLDDDDLAAVIAFVEGMKSELSLARELNIKLSARIAGLEAEVAWLQERLAQVT